MEQKNGSSFTGFILLGFSDRPQLELVLLVLLLIFYIFTLLGNTTIIALSYLDPHLHTPMYFFLSNLSFLDMPLHYTVIMHPRLCALMASASWIIGFANSLLQTVLIFLLPLCGRNKLDHFLCEIPPFLKLACVDTTMNVHAIFFTSVIILLTPVALIMFSYGLIVRAVLRIKSTAGQRKAFGTCGSHLTVVSLLFGTAIYVYFQPSSNNSQDQDKFMSLFYTVIIPMTNPLIYTLRNKDVKGAMEKVLWKDSDSR
ncbi:unnamed protein product [Rangifer tarandus platyrhynchus]|uniref:Uncharacterized protein n=3 Tax=Rangifer tarandus platyrhynchus TaxID=3082113 RepID=A0ACB0EVB6_RANTA|nr:unnamed protein product [Rangifer tarandus platyrhynchus]CAI9704292.1 unnamed protein product [Rangifer tarandus platyrhynchus]